LKSEIKLTRHVKAGEDSLPPFCPKGGAMFYETVLETEDKSYYADLLAEITGISRAYWGIFSLPLLKKFLYEKRLKKGGKSHASSEK